MLTLRTYSALLMTLGFTLIGATAAEPPGKHTDFDDLVAPGDVREALLRLDPPLLADIASNTQAAEKRLGRPRPGVSAGDFYELAIRVAGARRSLPVLDRLAADEGVKTDARLTELLSATRLAAGTARNTDPALIVALDQISPDQYALFRGFLMQIQDAKALADKESLAALSERLAGGEELTVAQRTYLSGTIKNTIAALPAKPSAAVLAVNLAREAAARQQAEIAVVQEVTSDANGAGSSKTGNSGGEKPTALAGRLVEDTAALTDESFEGKVDLVKIGKAWGRADAVALADHAFLMADAERVLGRPHRHVPAKTLFQASLRLALGRDDATVARIEKKLKEERGPEFDGKADVLAMVTATASVASASRKTRPAFLVSIDKTSPESFRTFRTYLDQIQAATAQRDTGMLTGLAEGLDSAVELDDAQRAYLIRQTAEGRGGGGTASEAVKLLRLLEADSRGKALPPINAQVVKFCRERVGQKVDNGECAMLAVRALEAARAKQFPPSGLDADYVWGRLIQKPAEAIPGDLIQFRNVQLKVTRPDGSWQSWSYGHHTAVIYSVDGPGRFTLLQQNVGSAGKSADKKKIVQVGTLDLSNLKQGKIWIYRPVAR